MWFIVSQEGATGIAVANSARTRCLDLLKGFATLGCPKLDSSCYRAIAELFGLLNVKEIFLQEAL